MGSSIVVGSVMNCIHFCEKYRFYYLFCSPFGAVIQPFVDALHVQGGHTLFPVGSASHLQSESDSEDADDVQKDSVAGSSKNKKTTSMGSQSKKSKK